MLPQSIPNEPVLPNPSQVLNKENRSYICVANEKPIAYSKYGKRRSNILIEATKDFCRLERPENTDIYRYKEFFYQFIENLDISDKRIISAMLARMSFTPRAIALYLAMDDLQVAAPFLLFSPALGESDLKAIGQKMGVDYKRVMRRRRGDELVSIDFPDLDDLHSKSAPKEMDNIHEPATTFLSQGEEQAQDSMLSSDEIMALASSGGRLGRQKKQKTGPEPELPTKAVAVTLDDLYALARSSNLNGFANSASQLSGLSSEEILKLVKNQTGDEIVYFIKALDFQSTKDIQILMMLCPRYGRQLQSFKDAKKLLSELNIGICQMIFNEVGAKFKLPGAPDALELNGNRSDQGFARSLKERRSEIGYSRANLTPRKDARDVFGKKAS